jgi:hypothetical protein
MADDPASPRIRGSSKFWPYFKDALGAIDGSHIHSAPPSASRASYRNRKGFVSQNCLFICSFDLEFVYAYTGWEGSATDARVYEAARSLDLVIPEGKYYLADAGFPSCNQLLVPYRGVRYHLAEWGRAALRYVNLQYMRIHIHLRRIYRPTNKEELFNLRHSSARNVIERIFGVLKRRFRILLLAPEYSLTIQARIPASLCAMHNFIRAHDPEEGPLVLDESHDNNAQHDIYPGTTVNTARDDDVSGRRDRIAQDMWEDYQRVCQARGIGEDIRSDDEFDDELDGEEMV